MKKIASIMFFAIFYIPSAFAGNIQQETVHRQCVSNVAAASSCCINPNVFEAIDKRLKQMNLNPASVHGNFWKASDLGFEKEFIDDNGVCYVIISWDGKVIKHNYHDDLSSFGGNSSYKVLFSWWE